jgi:hypothetical protein
MNQENYTSTISLEDLLGKQFTQQDYPEGETFGKELFTEVIHYENKGKGWEVLRWDNAQRALLMKSLWDFASDLPEGTAYGTEIVMYPDMNSPHEVLMACLIKPRRSGGVSIQFHLKNFPSCVHGKASVTKHMRSLYERLRKFEQSQRVTKRITQGYPMDFRYYTLKDSFSCFLYESLSIL